MRVRRLAVSVLLLAGVISAGAQADLPPAGPARVISNFGRLISPPGQLTQLGYFPAGAALTPDGHFLWTVDAGRRSNGVQIVDTRSGAIAQRLVNETVGTQGGVVISHDGRRAYVSEPEGLDGGGHATPDRIAVYNVDLATGHATPAGDIAVPAPTSGQPVDDFPPNPREYRSYPAGLALSPDDHTLVAALDLSDRVAVIDTRTRAVTQVPVRSDQVAGDRAYPLAVAIGGGRAFVADEGDGTLASLSLANPSAVTRVTPTYADPSAINPKRTHPSAIVVSHDGQHVYVALTGADQVLELEAGNLTHLVRRIDVRRGVNVGTQPVGLGLSPDGRTLFVANALEDVVRVIALAPRRVFLRPGDTLPGTTDPEPRPGGASARAPGRAASGSRSGRRCRPARPRRRRRRHRASRRRGGRRLAGAARRRARHPHHRLRHRRRPRPRSGRGRARGRHRHRARSHRRRPSHRRAARGRVARGAAGRLGAVVVAPGDELARIPAGIYPRLALLGPRGRQLLIASGKGVGPGSTYVAGESVSEHVLGTLQRIALPAGESARDTQLVHLGQGGDAVPVPVDHRETAPAGSPLVGPSGHGPSQQIKYVFYVVTENKTYDSVLGDLARGNGDPCLALFGEFRRTRVAAGGSPCPQNRFGTSNQDVPRNPGQANDGTPITPNEHQLARTFVTLDNTYANSETSDDGHIWTSSAYAPDHDLRATFSNNGPGGYPFDLVYPISAPPKGFFFDSLVRQGVSFFNYGEAAAGLATPDSQATPAEQSTRDRVIANSEYITQYPSSAAIDVDPITHRETYDHDPGALLNPAQKVSRMQYFRRRFQSQLAACPVPSSPATCAVPQYQELLFPNNHTAGTTPGRRTPDALVRDTDQAIGQLVSDISHSPIWPYSAIFVVQDDAQGGADHVEGHRITSLIASPYARRGAVVSTHYDQVSVIRTIEMILGLQPTYLYDTLARPMWEAFQTTPNDAAYNASNIPEALMEERNASTAPLGSLSARIRWVADTVPEHLLNRIQWAYRYGTPTACPTHTGSLGLDVPCASDVGQLADEQAKVPGELAALRRAASRHGVR